MLFSFVLVERFDHFTLLGFPALLSLLVVLGIAWAAKQRFFQALSGLLLLSLSALLCLWDVDALLTARQYSGQKVLARVNSPYGRLLVTELAGQYNFIENGLPLFSAPNVEQAEEMAHYAMAQRPDARRVLLMSGGIAGAARELLKHRVNNVVYVELDPAILELGRAHFADSLADPRLQMVSRDGRRFIQRTRQHFEVVILGLPDPATSQLNRFFTAEFFAEVKSAMTTNGVLAFSLGHYENYLSAHLARMLASACQSLRQSFANILVLPVGRVYFLASDGPLSTDIAGALERSKIHTQLVNRHYLDAMLTTDRMAAVQSALQQPAARNTDFAPVLYYYHLRYWMSQFQSRFGAPEAAFLVVLAVYLFRLRAAPLALFASGFAASALEVVILLAFQVLYGSLYRQLGIIVTLFMAGLALGAWTANRGGLRAGQKELAGLSLAVAAFGAALPAALHGVRWVGGLPPAWWLGQWLIPLLGFVLATLIGWQFPLASRVDFASATGTAARLYSADLLGACLGAFLASTLLIPLVGVTTTCLLSALLNGLAGLRVWRAAPRLGFLA
jgi:spermidine synthase